MIEALGGLVLLVVFVRYGFRWFFYVLAAWLLLCLWAAVAAHSAPVAWGSIIAPFLYVAYRWGRHQDSGRTAENYERIPKADQEREYRGRIRGPFLVSREQRAFRRAFKDELGDDGKPAMPRILKVRRDGPDRTTYALALPANQNFAGLGPTEKAKVEARWRWLLDCRDVTITPHVTRGRRGWVAVHRGPKPPEPDYTDDLGQWPGWPGCDDFSQAIPVGVAASSGGPVTMTLVGKDGSKNILIFGAPGSGKSVGAAEIIGTAAQDPTVELWAADGGGGTDMEFWRPRLARYEIKTERVFLMLQELKDEIDRRGEEMRKAHRRVIDPHDPKIVLVLEEFATFTDEKRKRSMETGLVRTSKEDDPSEAFVDALAYIGRLGRKYGVSLVALVQVPTVDAVPGKVRRLFQFRWGFRCLDAQGWRAGFGPGIPYVRLNAERPGDSVLMAETSEVRMRSYFIPDEQLDEIALAYSLDPGASPASPPDTISEDLCLENGENVVPLPVSPVPQSVPQPVPLTLEPWDRAVFAYAVFPQTSKDILANVAPRALSTAQRRLRALTDAGYLSAPPRPSVTAPQTWVTTLTGRAEITAAEVSITPDGAAGTQASVSGHQPTEGGAQ